MGLKETLRSDLTEAIRSSDKVVSGTIRMVLTAITTEEVAGKEARTLSEDEIITVLSREAKKRREAAEEFAKGNRPEKAAEEKAEGEVIAKYLPAQLSEDDIKKLDEEKKVINYEADKEILKLKSQIEEIKVNLLGNEQAANQEAQEVHRNEIGLYIC